MSGKGSKRRPSRVGRQEIERRWEQAFGNGHGDERCGEPKCGCMAEARGAVADAMVAEVRKDASIMDKLDEVFGP